MNGKGFTLNQIFVKAHNVVTGLTGARFFRDVTLPDPRLRVPIDAITLDQQIAGRDIEVENVTRAYSKLSRKIQARTFQELAGYSLNGTFARESTITFKRAESSVGGIGRSGSEILSAGSTVQDNGWTATYLGTVMALPSIRTAIAKRFSASKAIPVTPSCIAAFVRALLVPLIVGAIGGKLFAANWAYLLYTIRAFLVVTSLRAKTIVVSSSSKARSTLSAVSVRSYGALSPHRAGSTWATPTTYGRTLPRYELFAAIQASVNVLFSQDMNLIDRLAFWSGSLGCFEHPCGPFILPQARL